jgi:2-polyprenyl-3-methyl-5-hydroxy-6-metoxy-1,4-benzoquinol methylase
MRVPPRALPEWPESWKLSHHYDRLELGGPDRESLGYQYAYWGRRDVALELVARAEKPPARVLDVAAAQGNFTLTLAERGYKVTWNDLRGDLADYTRLKYERGDVTYLPGNLLELAVDEPWDIVVACEVIEHVAHPDEFLRGLARLVKPGGYIVLTTPNGGYFRNELPRFDECPDPSVFESQQFKPDGDGHIFLLHLDELRALSRKAGLEVVEARLLGNPLTRGHFRLRRLLPLVPGRVVHAFERATRALPEWAAAPLMTTTAALLRRRAEAP